MSEITEAAIKADMEHRGFEDAGCGQFELKLGRGSSQPYSVMVRDGSGWVEPSYPDKEPVADAFHAEVQAEVFDYWPGVIESLFHTWLYQLPSPEPFSVAAEFASTAANELSTGVNVGDGTNYSPGNARLPSDLSNLAARIKQLSGDYAVTFSDSYVTPLGGVLERQRSLAGVLAIAAEAEAEVWSRASADVREIMSQSLEAMKASGPLSGGGTDWKVILTVTGALAAGVAAFATAGSILAVGGALVTAGASAASNLIERPPEPSRADVSLGADDPRAVLRKIDRALNDSENSLSDHVREQEEHIQTIVRDAATAVAGSSRGMFDLSRSEIVTAPPGQVLSREQSVIVSPEIIGRITCLWIPSIVGDLLLARRLLPWESVGAWQRPAGIGLGATGPQGEFQALQNTAIGLLGNTATELEDAGNALLAAARLIGLADDDIGREYRKLAREITETNRNYVA